MDEKTKYCNKCGKSIPNDSDFCPYCGAKQNVISKVQLTKQETSAENESSKNNSELKAAVNLKKSSKRWYKRWWIWGIIIIFILIGINSLGKQSSSSGTSSTHTTSSSSTTTSHKDTSSTKTSVRKSVQVLEELDAEDLNSKGESNAQNIQYGELIKSNHYYAKPYSISKGEVLQASESKGMTNMLVYINDDTDQLFEVIIRGKTKAIEDDYVAINGVLDKIYNYDTQSGGSNTVPTIVADKVTVLGADTE